MWWLQRLNIIISLSFLPVSLKTPFQSLVEASFSSHLIGHTSAQFLPWNILPFPHSMFHRWPHRLPQFQLPPLHSIKWDPRRCREARDVGVSHSSVPAPSTRPASASLQKHLWHKQRNRCWLGNGYPERCALLETLSRDPRVSGQRWSRWPRSSASPWITEFTRQISAQQSGRKGTWFVYKERKERDVILREGVR